MVPDGIPSRLMRWLTPLLLLASLAAAVWWICYVPYDPQAVYRAIPSSAITASRHESPADRWSDLIKNPLAAFVGRAAGLDPELAGLMATDEESHKWFKKLTGRETVLAVLPDRFGGEPAVMAASWIGRDSRSLRNQLSIFKPSGYELLGTRFPGRKVWRVLSPDIPFGKQLVITFDDGLLIACLSSHALAIAEVLGALDGHVARLVDEDADFRSFVEADDGTIPDRIWISENAYWLDGALGEDIHVDIPVLREKTARVLLTATVGPYLPEMDAAGMDVSVPVGLIGNHAAVAVSLQKACVPPRIMAVEGDREVRYAFQLVSEIADDSLLGFLLDGELSGRVTWGALRTLNLPGLRVPTLLLASPAADEESMHRQLQQRLDECNARYRGAFIFHPKRLPSGATLYVLESAGGNEWVDALAAADRPAYAIWNGWLLVSSNTRALEELLSRGAASAFAPWADEFAKNPAAVAWVDWARTGKIVRDGLATWTLVQTFTGGGIRNEHAGWRNTLNWLEALSPLRDGLLVVEHRDGILSIRTDLGLSELPPME